MRDGSGHDDRNALGLLVAFIVVWLVLAIAPHDRAVWALEHGLTVVVVGVLVLTRRTMRFSDGALASIGLFLVLHSIGAHFTYAEAPIGDWLASLLPLGDRNPYDRFVHFAYGLLVTPAVIELLDARARPAGTWRVVLPVLFVAGTAAIYEVLEAAALVLVGAGTAERFLAAQGDPFDAQWDQALAILGASLIAVMTIAARARPSSL